MKWLEKLTRPEIQSLTPYSSARNEFAGAGDHYIYLDANESPWPPYTFKHSDDALNRYPEPQPQELTRKLAELYGVSKEQLLITRGADEGIELLIRCFCTPGKDNILYTPPTFSAYAIFAKVNGNDAITYDLNPSNNFALDAADLLKKCNANTNIILLCSPNNPTGALVPIEAVEQICEKLKGKSLVAVDEAYIEFSDAPSATTLLDKHENLVVFRTLSKAFGLAGERIGTTIAHPDIIRTLRKVLAPYPIPTSAAKNALEALSPVGLAYASRNVKETVLEKERVILALSASDQVEHIFPSDTNYLLVKVKDSADLYKSLMQRGIIVRNRSKDISNTLRISIGNKEENNLLIQSITNETSTETSTERTATQSRKTKETEITAHISLDPNNPTIKIDTGIAFFDHMLEQLAKHSGITLELKAEGDTHIDAHHTVEDVAIVLGQAFKAALGDKQAIGRYGFVLPMDEACTQAAIDLSGRGALVFEADFQTPQTGDFPTEMLKHFYWTLAMNMDAAIHIHITGENAHHMIESSFKAFAKCLKQAVAQTGKGIPSTKGVL